MMLNIPHHQGNANQKPQGSVPHACQNGHHRKEYKKQMLERMRRKGNPCMLLVGMQTGTATARNSMDVAHKTKHRTTI